MVDKAVEQIEKGADLTKKEITLSILEEIEPLK